MLPSALQLGLAVLGLVLSQQKYRRLGLALGIASVIWYLAELLYATREVHATISTDAPTVTYIPGMR